MTLAYAPAHSFIHWMAQNPGYLICATMWRYPSSLSVLMELRG